MKWVAIDIGRNEIKAAVRDKVGSPTKLLYNSNGRIFSYMPSEGYISSNGKVYMGNELPILGALFPEKINDLGSSQDGITLHNTLFAIIRNAASRHYNESSLGVVLLYENVENESAVSIARACFDEVQVKCSSEVLSSALFDNEGTSLIIDISRSALKISLVKNGRKTAFYQSDELGFSTIDISDLIGYTLTDSNTEAELFLHGQILENVRICLCQGKDYLTLLDVLNIDSANASVIKNKFEESMTRYLFRCFEVCSQNLKKLSMTWGDVNNIVCCGSTSNYYRMKDTFSEYLKGCGTDISYFNLMMYNADAQWAATFSTLQLPLIEEREVIIEF